jgi:antitoxin ParD1/3/4
MATDVSRLVEERFKARIRDSAYPSADDLLDDALQLLEQREAFRRAVAQGLAQADRGELRDGEAVFAELEADLDKLSSGT